jgi:two-component system, cell cycle response regulator DivK
MSNTKELNRIRVLIVDDEPATRRTLCQLLQMSGYFCALAANGAQALEMVHSFLPQAILMDLKMPILDGFETTRRLKAHEETRPIPVLALTASTTPKDREEAAQAGVDDFLVKPINLDQLLLSLRRYLPNQAGSGRFADQSAN